MSKVYFSSVWEDYCSLKTGLSLQENDTVLSISSSGDNIFNFVADKVKKVIALDINPAQLYLAKLKLEIIRQCDSQKTAELLTGNGNKTENKNLIDKLLSSDESFRKYLSSYDFSQGIENIGEFEKKVLPIITLFTKKFLHENDFQSFTPKKANFWIRILPILFSFRGSCKLFLPDFPYQYINVSIGKSLQESLEKFLSFNDLSKNWYAQKIYYADYKLLPPFLCSDNFQYIKSNWWKIDFVENDVLNFLKQQDDSSIDKINLSDIFDWCSQEEYIQVLQESYRVLSPSGRIFYWELFVSRELPSDMVDKYVSLIDESSKIHAEDNIPFYHRVVILKRKEFAAKEKNRV